MVPISSLLSILSILIFVFLIVLIIKTETSWNPNFWQLYLATGAITYIVVVVIVVLISLRNADLATKIWATFFEENLFENIISWLIFTPLSEYFIEKESN